MAVSHLRNSLHLSRRLLEPASELSIFPFHRNVYLRTGNPQKKDEHIKYNLQYYYVFKTKNLMNVTYFDNLGCKMKL